MGAGPGRPKGSTNKVTREFRETVQALLDNNSKNVEKWLLEVAKGKSANKRTGFRGTPPDPAKALDLLAKLAEYAAPKLGRIEHVGEGGKGPIVTRIELVPLSK